MITFVINLDEATDRWKHYKGLDVHRWRATHYNEVDSETDKKMISYHNVPKINHLKKCACMLSHLELWKHIVKHKLNGVTILEDDAMKRYFYSTPLPADGISYLGGATFTPHMTGKFIQVELEKGINKIDFNKYRVLMTMSYYIPNYEIAQKLIDMIESKRRWRAIDVMLGEFQKNDNAYLYYPAVFSERPNVSQIQSTSRNKFADENFTLQPVGRPSPLHQARSEALLQISLPQSHQGVSVSK